jgi:hypothetical protein
MDAGYKGFFFFLVHPNRYRLSSRWNPHDDSVKQVVLDKKEKNQKKTAIKRVLKVS